MILILGFLQYILIMLVPSLTLIIFHNDTILVIPATFLNSTSGTLYKGIYFYFYLLLATPCHIYCKRIPLTELDLIHYHESRWCLQLLFLHTCQYRIDGFQVVSAMHLGCLYCREALSLGFLPLPAQKQHFNIIALIESVVALTARARI